MANYVQIFFFFWLNFNIFVISYCPNKPNLEDVNRQFVCLLVFNAIPDSVAIFKARKIYGKTIPGFYKTFLLKTLKLNLV